MAFAVLGDAAHGAYFGRADELEEPPVVAHGAGFGAEQELALAVGEYAVDVVGGQAVFDGVPRSHGSNENVTISTVAWIVIQRAERDHREITSRVQSRHARAAPRTEYLRKVLSCRQSKGPQLVLSAQESDAVDSGKTVGRVRGGACLATT